MFKYYLIPFFTTFVGLLFPILPSEIVTLNLFLEFTFP